MAKKDQELPDDYLSRIYDGHQYSITQFDKNVLYISSGAFGLSLTFIEKIVPLEDAICKAWLITSFYFFGTTVILSFISHYISIFLIEKYIKKYQRDNYKENEDYRLKLNKFLRMGNVILIFTLFLGLLFLLRFIQINLK